MAIAVDIAPDVAFAARVTARPSATFLRLAASADAALPQAGVHAGLVEVGGSAAPCSIRVLADDRDVWCQPRGPVALASVGQRVRVSIIAGSGSSR